MNMNMNMNMMMKHSKTVQCAHCGTSFTKPVLLIENEKKINRQHHFCSLSCVNDYNITLLEVLEKELKSFKYILSLVDENPEKIKTSTDIDVLYLRTIWDNQYGKCIYSKVSLILPTTNAEVEDVLSTAVIDKINPSVDYIKGNIQFISVAMSYIKRDLSHEKTLKLVKLIKTS